MHQSQSSAPSARPKGHTGFSDRTSTVLAGLGIALVTLAAYAGTFHVPFVFDDIPSILHNPTILQLWPPGDVLSPPADWGFTVSGRPVLNLSLAINHAISGFSVWSYHALNLAIHACAGLTLFGILRRTLTGPKLAAVWSDRALPLAFAITAVWVLHPLQTESVTYVIQRAESLMGLFFLLTLYAFIRALDSPRPRRWMVVSFFSCLLGVGTKEVTALAPLLVLLYDRTFVSGSFSAAWRRHRGRHLALVATWLPLAGLLLATGGNRGGTIGFDVSDSWSDYWLTQFEAVTRYLSLSFWPHPLVFDYGRIRPDGGWVTALWALPVLALLIATLVALRRQPVAGFLGAWFFGILAPTSIVPGLNQMIVEHRMYLPLAAVLSGAFALLARRLPPRGILVGGLVVALAAAYGTVQRNFDYRDAETLWRDTLAKRPTNARAHTNLGTYLYQDGRNAEALTHYAEAVRLQPDMAQFNYNLGLGLTRAGREEEAITAFTTAVRILPYYAAAHLDLGILLMKAGRIPEAATHFAAAVRHDAAPAEVHFRIGVAAAQFGHLREAIEHYAQTVQLEPDHVQALSNWGVALHRLNSFSAAVERFEAALRVKPDLADAHFNLGLTLTALGRAQEAMDHYAAAVRSDPGHAEARLNLGIALGQSGNLPAALIQLEEATRLRPDSSEAHTNFAVGLTAAGRHADALTHYEAALRLRPDDAAGHLNVGYGLAAVSRWREAREHIEQALRLQPTLPGARELLRNLPEAAPPAAP